MTKNILLFADILSNINFPKKILNTIKKKYNVININYTFNDLKIFDNLDDLLFENVTKNIYNMLDKNNKYITIGINQGCHICNFFSNKYKNIITMQILFNNRRINEENYNKTIIRGYRFLEIKYNKEIAEKYKLGIQTNDDLIDKISKKKYIDLIHHTINLKIREQYEKIPITQKCKTYIFDQLVMDVNIMQDHNLKSKKTRKIKNIHTIEQAMLDHYKANMDKIKQNNNMINKSTFGLVVVDYEIDILGDTIFSKNRMDKLLQIL
jgi:hypothetical protein